MMCFMDRCFCSSPACTNKCGRKLTPELIQRGIEWWGGEDFPVAIATFCDLNGELIEEETCK